MATTLSYQGVLYRSNVFDRTTLRKFSGSSGEANVEFGTTLDLTSGTLPTTPYQISTQTATVISFLFLQVIGGSIKIRLVKTKEEGVALDPEQTLELIVGNTLAPTGDTLLMSGMDVNELYILEVPQGCIVEIFGMGY